MLLWYQKINMFVSLDTEHAPPHVGHWGVTGPDVQCRAALLYLSGGSRGGGGGGSRGSGPPPPFGPRCRLFNIGPKVGPPPFLLVDLRCSGGSCGWRHADNVQGGGGVLVKNLVSAAWPPPPFQKSWIRPCTYMVLIRAVMQLILEWVPKLIV